MINCKDINKKIKDMTGQRFERLVVISYAGSNKRKNAIWLCVCDCGTEKIIDGANLRRGYIKSCGCLAKENVIERNTIHGGKYYPEYQSWIGMRQRCCEEKSGYHKNYGERGIKICFEWMYGDGDKTGFECFYEDMGKKPTSKYSIERIDNNGDYSPENCKWATPLEQGRNKRNNRHIIIGDKKMVMSEACEKYNISPQLVNWRLKKGWGVEMAFKNPVKRSNQ